MPSGWQFEDDASAFNQILNMRWAMELAAPAR